MISVSLCQWREGSEEAILHIGRSLLDNAHLAAKLLFNLGKALLLAGLDTWWGDKLNILLFLQKHFFGEFRVSFLFWCCTLPLKTEQFWRIFCWRRIFCYQIARCFFILAILSSFFSSLCGVIQRGRDRVPFVGILILGYPNCERGGDGISPWRYLGLIDILEIDSVGWNTPGWYFFDTKY